MPPFGTLLKTLLILTIIKVSLFSETQNSTNSGGPSCNSELILSFGLEGNTHPETREHRYCPEIKSNCCTVKDEYSQMVQWNSWNKILVETYYETYL